MSSLLYSTYNTGNTTQQQKRTPIGERPKLTPANFDLSATLTTNTYNDDYNNEARQNSIIQSMNQQSTDSNGDDNNGSGFPPMPIMTQRPHADPNAPSLQYTPMTVEQASRFTPRFSNYQMGASTPQTVSFDIGQSANKPYYALNNTGGDTNMNQLLEEMRAIRHLLEEHRSAKTDHVLEEFTMYAMFGIGLIYIVDSYARSGKYTR
jgi:hypothetical protein